jgi:hypothetical protein
MREGEPNLEIIESKKEQVKSFLKVELPETEERIEEKMDPECQVCVVIPCCGERDYILRSLKTLADQEDVKSNQFEVVYIINNPSEHFTKGPHETEEDYQKRNEKASIWRKDNQETIKFLKSIKNGSNKEIGVDEKETVDRIRESGIKFYFIDKASPGKELPDNHANVGGARNRGVAEAIERFLELDRNGIISQTDGDARVAYDYIRSLIDVYNNNPDVVGVSGIMHFDVLEGKEALPKEFGMQEEMRWIYKKVVKILAHREEMKRDGEWSNEPNIDFGGANMSSRAYEAALAGGIQKEGGGEDTYFGQDLAKIGKTMWSPEIVTYPADRISDRTTTGHGKGRRKQREMIEKNGAIQVYEAERIIFESDTRPRLEKLIASRGVSLASLKDIFTFKEEQLLSDESLQEMADELKMLDQLPGKKEVFNVKSLKDAYKPLMKNLDKLSPQLSIIQAVEQLRQRFLNDPELSAKFIDALEKKEAEFENTNKNMEVVKKITDLIFKRKLKKINIENVRKILDESSEDFIEVKDQDLDILCKAIKGSKNAKDALDDYKWITGMSVMPEKTDPLCSGFEVLYAIREVLEGQK